MKWCAYACRFAHEMFFYRSLSSSNIEVLEEGVFAMIPGLDVL